MGGREAIWRLNPWMVLPDPRKYLGPVYQAESDLHSLRGLGDQESLCLSESRPAFIPVLELEGIFQKKYKCIYIHSFFM